MTDPRNDKKAEHSESRDLPATRSENTDADITLVPRGAFDRLQVLMMPAEKT